MTTHQYSSIRKYLQQNHTDIFLKYVISFNPSNSEMEVINLKNIPESEFKNDMDIINKVEKDIISINQ